MMISLVEICDVAKFGRIRSIVLVEFCSVRFKSLFPLFLLWSQKGPLSFSLFSFVLDY